MRRYALGYDRVAIAIDEHLGDKRPAIVGRRHRSAIGARRTEEREVAFADPLDRPGLCEGVAGLADRTDDVGDECLALRPHRGEFVPRIVKRGAGEVVHRRIDDDERMFLSGLHPQDASEQDASLRGDEASGLEQQCHIPVAGDGCDHRTIGFDVGIPLIRPIGYAEAAAQVDSVMVYPSSKAALAWWARREGVKPEWILRTVTEEKCTIVWLLVPWAQDILDAIESGRVNLEHYLLDQWRLMHIGAQPVPPSLIKRWLKYFPHHKYDTNYGLSESIGPGCVHLGVDNIEKIGAIGKAGYLWQTRILDERGNDVAPGEIGELAVKGPGVMKCYYKNPEATAEILHGDWLWTGDMAREDKDGFIYLVDRKKDVIISGGENLYPVQIEDFLRRNEKIKDVAVIGLPDQRLGEIAAAIIELKDGADCTETEIQDFCRELPRYKRPRRVIFAKVPRNPTGKIEKPVLRQIYCGGRLVEEQTKA